MPRFISFLIAIIASISILGHKAQAESASIANSGKALMPIIISANASGATRQSAQTLAGYLQKMSGADFDIQTGDGNSGIVVGEAKDFPAFKSTFGDRKMQSEDYILRSFSHGIYIIGATNKGMDHAIWDFLYHLGYRRFFPNPHWEIIPQQTHLTIDINVKEHPDFFFRTIWTTGFGWHGDLQNYRDKMSQNWAEWAQANRLGGAIKVQSGHAWNTIVAENKAEFDKHPEYFALMNGKRETNSPQKMFCISNAGLRQLVVQYALDYFKDHPEEDCVSIEPADTSKIWCQCENCQSIGSSSDQMAFLANEVADAVRQKYPDKYVSFYAYSRHSDPPTIKLHPGVIVPETTALTYGKVKSFEQRVAGWRDAGAMVGVRDYLSVWNWEFAVPHIAKASQLDTLPAELTHYRQMGMGAFSSEATNNWGANGLGYYIAARILWDGKEAQHVDALVTDFLDKSFGDAREPMRRFYELTTGIDGTMVPPFDSEYIQNLYQLLNDAWQKTNNDAVKTRLSDLVLYVHYLELYNKQRQIADPVERQKNWEDILRFTYRIYPTQMIATSQLARGRGFSGKNDTFDYKIPREVNIANNWRQYQKYWDTGAPFNDAEIQQFIKDGITNNNATPLPQHVQLVSVSPNDSDSKSTFTIKQTGVSLNRALLYRSNDGQITITFARVYGRQTVQSTAQENYSWIIKDANNKVIKMSGVMQRGASITFPAKANTPYYFYTCASAQISVQGAAVALQTNLNRGRLHLYSQPTTLYINVPADLSTWQLSLDTLAPGETAEVTIFSPSGKAMGTLETGGKTSHQAITLKGEPGIWKIQTGKASTGILYDYLLRFDKALAPWASLDPTQIMKAQ